MKESISGTALFMIVILFVVLFAGYLSLSINQNKAFAVKNAIIRVIERHGKSVNSAAGLVLEPGFSSEIKKELEEVQYRTNGICNRPSKGDTGWTGFNSEGEVTFDEKAVVFCVKAVGADGGLLTGSKKGPNPSENLHYFKVKTFYQFDLPVFRALLDLTIEGTTKAMM